MSSQPESSLKDLSPSSTGAPFRKSPSGVLDVAEFLEVPEAELIVQDNQVLCKLPSKQSLILFDASLRGRNQLDLLERLVVVAKEVQEAHLLEELKQKQATKSTEIIIESSPWTAKRPPRLPGPLQDASPTRRQSRRSTMPARRRPVAGLGTPPASMDQLAPSNFLEPEGTSLEEEPAAAPSEACPSSSNDDINDDPPSQGLGKLTASSADTASTRATFLTLTSTSTSSLSPRAKEGSPPDSSSLKSPSLSGQDKEMSEDSCCSSRSGKTRRNMSLTLQRFAGRPSSTLRTGSLSL